MNWLRSSTSGGSTWVEILPRFGQRNRLTCMHKTFGTVSKVNCFIADSFDKQDLQEYFSVASIVSGPVNLSKQSSSVHEGLSLRNFGTYFWGILIDRSRKGSSLRRILPQRKHFSSLSKLPWKVSCTILFDLPGDVDRVESSPCRRSKRNRRNSCASYNENNTSQ